MGHWFRAVTALSTWLAFAPAPALAGVTQVLQVSGPFVPSIDGAGNANTSNMSYTITRPTAGATVYKVYATVTSVWGNGDPGQNCLTVGGIPLPLTQVQVDAGNTVHTRFDEVTGQLSGYLNALPVGPSVIPVIEGGGPIQNDGNGLIVLWQDPTFAISTFALAFASELTGQNPQMQLTTDPINTAAPGFRVDIGIGIAFSAGAPMVSETHVEGVLIATDTGGYDDGAQAANGALYTLGGDGDGPGSERYNVTPYIANGEVSIGVRLGGNTFDDFAVVIWLWGIGVTVDMPCEPGDPDADGDGIADLCDICPGFDDTIDLDLDLVPDGCDPCPYGPNDVDGDGDGVADGCDLCPTGDDNLDDDADGFANACDASLFFLSPKRGPIGGGTRPSVIGEKFDDTCVVSFDGVDALTWYVDEYTLEAETEVHDAGLVDVAVNCVSGADTLIGGFTFYDDESETGVPPDLITVLPNQVGVAGGEEVTLSGTGFANDVAVTVDGVDAEANRIDAETITLVVPEHAAGIAAVEVVNGDGLSDTLEGALLYVAPVVLPEEQAPITEIEDPGAGEPQVGGCSHAPFGLRAAPLLLVGLFVRRRRALALGLLAGCSEYEVLGQGEVAKPGIVEEVPPVALTGPAASALRDVTVLLDGSASYDPDDEDAAVTFAWELSESPGGSSPTLSDETTANPVFSSDELGTYVFGLRVTDEDGLESENPAAQVVEVLPWRDLEVTLQWGASVDLDLHLIAPGGAYYGTDDCFFGNSTPKWGESGSGEDDPLLAEDDDGAVDGTHTERITLVAPEEGVHQIVAVYWNDRGTPVRANGQITVSGAGELIVEADVSLDAAGDAVLIGEIDWRTLGFQADGTVTTHADLGGPPFNE